MTKIPKNADDSRPESDQSGIISLNNRKVSQISKIIFFMYDTFIDRHKILLIFRAITKTKNRYWKNDVATGSIAVWMN